MKTTYLYCYASGLAKFYHKVPDGALPIDHQTAAQRLREDAKIKAMTAAWNKDPRKPYPAQPWKESMRAKMRLGYDGSMLVPGIPEAKDQREALDALQRFRAWAVKK